MDHEFEKRLLEGGIDEAGPWIEEYCKSHPLDVPARGYRVFAHALEKRDGALEEAEAVLAVSPDNESALAALFFLLVNPLGEDYENRFVNDKGSRLGPHWIAIFSVLGFRDKAEEVYILNIIDGNPWQIADVCFKYEGFKLTQDPEKENKTVEELIKEFEEEIGESI